MAQRYFVHDDYVFEGDVNFRGSISGFFMGTGKVTTGTAAPTSGAYDYRHIVWNTAPLAGAPLGWVCVSRVDSTVKTKAVATDTSLDVLDSTGMTAGDIVGVSLQVVDGEGDPTGATEWHWTTIASVTDGDTIVLTAEIPALRQSAVGSYVFTMLWKALPSVPAVAAHVADAKVNYTTGDLDAESEIIAAFNTTNGKINSILAALEGVKIIASS